MSLWDFFKRRAGEDSVVFAGNRWEAEMVIHLLEGEGFHPLEWADMPGPYIGPVGMARVVVPLQEYEDARKFLASLKDREIASGEWENPEGGGEEEE